MRDIGSTVLELVGLGLLVAAAATIHTTVGIAAAGIACVLLGWLLAR